MTIPETAPAPPTIPRTGAVSQRRPLSPPADLAAANLVQDTFSLSRAGHDLLDEFTSLPPEAQAAFLEDLANLLRAGVVGTETLDYRGEAYTSFLSTRPADPAVAHARTLPRHS